MKRLTIFLFSALLLSVACGQAAETYPPYATKNIDAWNDLRGKKAPKLEVEQWLSGAQPDINKKVVLLDFWATWCPPCRALIAELNQYKKKFDKDLVIIGISDEPAATVQAFMESHPMEYNVAIDTNKRMNDRIGISAIPYVLVISPDGIVRWQGGPRLRADPLTEEKISQIIAASKAATPKH